MEEWEKIYLIVDVKKTKLTGKGNVIKLINVCHYSLKIGYCVDMSVINV